MKSKNNKTLKLIIFIAAFCLLATVAGYYLLKKTKADTSDNPSLATYTAKRGDLIISVTESGDIKAIESTDIQCRVEGRTTIISIVDEGYFVTTEDIENKKVLIELDSSQIEQQLSQQEVTFSNSQASYTEASESLQIQIKQNESDIKSGQMEVKFALMDFKKYLGEELANKLVADSNDLENASEFEILKLLQDERLGGEALQEITQLNSDIELAKSRLERAEDRLDGTKELFKEGYVAETELKADELDAQSSKAQVERAVIALELFELYEFPKQTEKLLSDYQEALRELDRIQARARSRLAQEKAQLRNKELTYELQKERLDKLKRQLESCTVVATAVGQVVYGSSLLDFRRRSREPIEVGAEVRERQNLISIPDTTQMKVDVKVPENMIGMVEAGQFAAIKMSAFPDKAFTGKVFAKAPLSDPENFWNPDQKVYTTQVSIDGSHDYIKTGMSAVVEIVVDHLKDVISVPVQSVTAIGPQKYCYVLSKNGPEKRLVETGLFNADYVEIKSGLDEGEQVLLVPKRLAGTESAKLRVQRNGPKTRPDRTDKTTDDKRPGQDKRPDSAGRQHPGDRPDTANRPSRQRPQ